MFCSKCGGQINPNTAFCPGCGTPINQQQAAVPVYVQPKIPGRGLGISGMVLGIIGLFYGSSMLMMSINLSDYSLNSFDGVRDGATTYIVIFSILSILAVSLAGAGRNKGYKNGVSTSGIVMGVIGLVLYFISIVIVAAD